MGEKKVVFLCSARANSKPENGDLNAKLAERIEKLGFQCIYAARDTDQTMSRHKIYRQNIIHIMKADVFIAVLKNYTKNLAEEVGYAAGQRDSAHKPWVLIGLEFGETDLADLMMLEAFDFKIPESELENGLKDTLWRYL